MNEITQMQTAKINNIQSHMENTEQNSKQTYKQILISSREDKNAKDNKCCIILLVSVAILFLILILMNYTRG